MAAGVVRIRWMAGHGVAEHFGRCSAGSGIACHRCLARAVVLELRERLGTWPGVEDVIAAGFTLDEAREALERARVDAGAGTAGLG